MATRQEFSDFLGEVELRAYKQALFAVQDEHIALDIVQDSMTKLVEKYAQKPLAELPPLFQRILQNTIRDFYRRQKSRSLWVTLFSSFLPDSDEKETGYTDIPDSLPVAQDFSNENNPGTAAERSQTLEIISKALETLSPRQREAFLLRYWEEMDISETAKIMNCSEGSVKAHCSRATHTLAALLEGKGVK
ncbi:RNA polymerase sigma factor [Betaproteobacteria bacterium PRO4]|uniref:RNA polymerase sigma factor n=1 Tax=Nitrosomonas sp. TaxID=42353 RepID=UPI002563E172|nr:RNA polymerase sigma factor [Nitrosomonas sp.]MDL1866631.1 RNA polymerase sigma factor [Betaproteobacteria bacterium PRO4]